MSDTPDSLTSLPHGVIAGMSFVPEESAAKDTDAPSATAPDSSPQANEEIPVPDSIPQIVRVTWELDANTPPLGNKTGRVFTLHLLENLIKMVAQHVDAETLKDMQEAATQTPGALAAMPFEMPDDGDFIQNLRRLVWTDDIEGVAVCYETKEMLTSQELQDAPQEEEARKLYLEKALADHEMSRMVVAATRNESWSVVHPSFDTDPEKIEQGPALVADLLDLIWQNRDGLPDA